MQYEHLEVNADGAIAWVTLNRPERLNALNPRMIAELGAFFGGLRASSPVRVVILRGAGRAFCAGLDLKEFQSEGASKKSVGEMLEFQRKVRDIMIAMRRCPQPVISIVNGSASGGGFALALASDIRLATADARMNASFIRLGLSGCDVGVSYFLPRMVGASVAAELMLTGRFLDAQRALALGLLSRIGTPEELEAEAAALAGEMLRATPLGLQLTKDALGIAIDANSLEAVIALEDRNQVLCTQGEDFGEGVAAFLEKRAPRYQTP
ncbi:enoyl-CoA hydratase-related protein [Variovorax robiniae]|uniref:Enoyl-CoA hydratase-related protein n=1 Tax=Variovorax robiniae TaxID=1836199 RepID=A0ABU8XC09_9BURK